MPAVHDVPPPEHPDETTTPQMEIAIDRLITGSTVGDAAKAAKVDRTTVHRWMKTHPGFQAAHNRRRREQLEASQLRLEALRDQALGNVATAVAAGNLPVSQWVLQHLAWPPAPPPTPALEEPLYLKIMATLRQLEDLEAHQKAAKRLSAARLNTAIAEVEKKHPGAARMLEEVSLRYGLDPAWIKLRRTLLEQQVETWERARGGRQVENGGGAAHGGAETESREAPEGNAADGDKRPQEGSGTS